MGEIITYLRANVLISLFRHGFHRGTSYVNNMLHLMDSFTIAHDCGKKSLAVFVVLARAFHNLSPTFKQTK